MAKKIMCIIFGGALLHILSVLIGFFIGVYGTIKCAGYRKVRANLIDDDKTIFTIYPITTEEYEAYSEGTKCDVHIIGPECPLK